MVNLNHIGWPLQMIDTLWAYYKAYKTYLGMSQYCLVYDKASHLWSLNIKPTGH